MVAFVPVSEVIMIHTAAQEQSVSGAHNQDCGQPGGHRWAEFHIRPSLSFDFLHMKCACAKKCVKRRGRAWNKSVFHHYLVERVGSLLKILKYM